MTDRTPTTDAGVASPHVVDLHRRAVAAFGDLVGAVEPDQWDLPTPCEGWTVRDLISHVTAENLWTPPLLGGRTIADVGDAFEGDVLGEDPLGAWTAAASAATSAAGDEGVAERTVHLSFGDAPAVEYLHQVFADHLIHGWDLAQALGADDRLDPGLVTACAAWFATVEDAYREGGAIGPRPAVAPDADAQDRLLARFGRSPVLAAVGRFNAAFARHDVEAVMAQVTDDCVFESTGPAPDGLRHEGRDAVAAAWRDLFAASPVMQFDVEELIGAGDRVIVRWTYDWGDGRVRGVDVMWVRDGKVAEKLSYVKG